MTTTESTAPTGPAAPTAIAAAAAPAAASASSAAAAAEPEPGRPGAAIAVGASLKGVLAAVRRLRGRETRTGPLSDAQYGLLFGLRDHQQLSSGELACLADLSPATAAEMLEGLAAAGLVARIRSVHDRRVVLTSLTARGHALLEERHARYAPRWHAALQEFSEAELRTTAAVLDRLRDLFNEL